MAGNRNEEMVYCSFCGKNQEEVKKIIAGNGVFICNECAVGRHHGVGCTRL